MATAYAYTPQPPAPAAPAAPAVAEYRRARFTADEFLRMEDLGVFEGHKVELADGELWEEPLPGMDHGELQGLLTYLLVTAASPDVYVSGEVSVRLGEHRVRDLDVALIRRDATRARIAMPADVKLAIEVSDTTLATDLHVKAAEYAQAGIPHYWVVDIRSSAVHAMRAPGPEGYAERSVVRFDEPLPVPGGGTIVIGVAVGLSRSQPLAEHRSQHQCALEYARDAVRIHANQHRNGRFHC